MGNISDIKDDIAQFFANTRVVPAPIHQNMDAGQALEGDGLISPMHAIDRAFRVNRRDRSESIDGETAFPAQKKVRLEAEEGIASTNSQDSFWDNSLTDDALNHAYDEVMASLARPEINTAIRPQTPAPNAASVNGDTAEPAQKRRRLDTEHPAPATTPVHREQAEANRPKVPNVQYKDGDILIPHKSGVNDRSQYLTREQHNSKPDTPALTQDYLDSKAVLIRTDSGSYLPKSQYFKTINIDKSKDEQTQSTERRSKFNNRMDELGLSHSSFAGLNPGKLTAEEKRLDTPGGTRQRYFNFKHAVQAGEGTPDVLIRNADGTHIAVWPKLEGWKTLADAEQTHGRQNIMIKATGNAYVPVDTLNLQKGPMAAEKMFAKFTDTQLDLHRTDMKSAYYRVDDSTYVSRGEYERRQGLPENRGKLMPDRAAADILFQTPGGEGLVTGKTLKFIDNAGYPNTFENEGLPPNTRTRTRTHASKPEVLVRIDEDTLVSGVRARELIDGAALEGSYKPTDIFIQTMGKNGLTGNYTDKQAVERRGTSHALTTPGIAFQANGDINAEATQPTVANHLNRKPVTNESEFVDLIRPNAKTSDVAGSSNAASSTRASEPAPENNSGRQTAAMRTDMAAAYYRIDLNTFVSGEEYRSRINQQHPFGNHDTEMAKAEVLFQQPGGEGLVTGSALKHIDEAHYNQTLEREGLPQNFGPNRYLTSEKPAVLVRIGPHELVSGSTAKRLAGGADLDSTYSANDIFIQNRLSDGTLAQNYANKEFYERNPPDNRVKMEMKLAHLGLKFDWNKEQHEPVAPTAASKQGPAEADKKLTDIRQSDTKLLPEQTGFINLHLVGAVTNINSASLNRQGLDERSRAEYRGR